MALADAHRDTTPNHEIHGGIVLLLSFSAGFGVVHFHWNLNSPSRLKNSIREQCGLYRCRTGTANLPINSHQHVVFSNTKSFAVLHLAHAFKGSFAAVSSLRGAGLFPHVSRTASLSLHVCLLDHPSCVDHLVDKYMSAQLEMDEMMLKSAAV